MSAFTTLNGLFLPPMSYPQQQQQQQHQQLQQQQHQ